MIWIYFFYYSVTTYLSFKARKTRLQGLFCPLQNKNGVFTFIPFDPKKIKLLARVFLSFYMVLL